LTAVTEEVAVDVVVISVAGVVVAANFGESGFVVVAIIVVVATLVVAVLANLVETSGVGVTMVLVARTVMVTVFDGCTEVLPVSPQATKAAVKIPQTRPNKLS
jgi:hypothetical protein